MEPCGHLIKLSFFNLNIIACKMHKRKYVPGPFRYFEGCDQIHCFCNHDGRIDCPPWMREDICEVFGASCPAELKRKQRAIYRLLTLSYKGNNSEGKSAKKQKSKAKKKPKAPKLKAPTTVLPNENIIYDKTKKPKQQRLATTYFPPTPKLRQPGNSAPSSGWKPRGPRRDRPA